MLSSTGCCLFRFPGCGCWWCLAVESWEFLPKKVLEIYPLQQCFFETRTWHVNLTTTSLTLCHLLSTSCRSWSSFRALNILKTVMLNSFRLLVSFSRLALYLKHWCVCSVCSSFSVWVSAAQGIGGLKQHLFHDLRVYPKEVSGTSSHYPYNIFGFLSESLMILKSLFVCFGKRKQLPPMARLHEGHNTANLSPLTFIYAKPWSPHKPPSSLIILELKAPITMIFFPVSCLFIMFPCLLLSFVQKDAAMIRGSCLFHPECFLGCIGQHQRHSLSVRCIVLFMSWIQKQLACVQPPLAQAISLWPTNS